MVATRPVDFRKGAEGLSALVREIMAADPFSGTVYVFRAKRADRIKLVFWDGTGLCLFAKRLEDGVFRWPKIEDGVMRLTQVGNFLGIVALAHYHQENYEEALHYCQLKISTRRFYPALTTLLASLGQLGHVEEARPLLHDFISLPADPQQLFDITTPYVDMKYREQLADGLRRAGVTSLR
jgi:tetratricopeptide (TPR) repeat protein